jgi:hypothetical protein
LLAHGPCGEAIRRDHAQDDALVAHAVIRRYEGRMIETVSVSRIPRTLIVALALVTVAGCAGGSSSSGLSPATPEPQMAAAPPAAQPTPPPPPSAPAGRAVQGAPAAAPPPAKQAALTPEEAKGKCWMRYENDRRAKSIDERLKLVEKCVDDTLRNQPPPRPDR